MNLLKEKIKIILKEKIKKLYHISDIEITLLNPPKKDLGDFAFPCFLLSKELKKNPTLISEECKNELKKDELFSEVNTAGPYLNFKLKPKFYRDIFIDYNINIPNIGNGNTIVVDYIGANVGKALHIGHMCTPNQGQVTCNLFRLFGYNVIGDSHLGDWGIIFGKLILAYKKWGKEEELKTHTVDYLQKLYINITKEAEKDENINIQVRKEFKELASGAKDSIELWKKFTSYSIKNIQIQYDRLGVLPTYNIGESFYEGLNLPKMGDYSDLLYSMSDIVKELIDKKIATKNLDNSVGVVFEESLKIPSVMLQKRDGTHGYLASDLASIKYRKISWNPKKMIYHVDVRQSLHFKQLFTIAKLAGWIDDNELIFAGNGFISLKDGLMSSRTGNIIKLKDLLDESELQARKILKEKRDDLEKEEGDEISKIIGIGAIKYGYLSKSRSTDMIFDWNEFMTFEGNSFPYVAYSYVRGLKIIKKSLLSKDEIEKINNSFDFLNQEDIDLITELFLLNEVLFSDLENILHHNLVMYAYSLAKKFSAFYNTTNILSIDNQDEKKLRLKIVLRYIETLEIIFKVLAIKLPNKM